MKFGSVCSGIEAASVAWHPFGWTAAWLAEIEPFPCAVLAHHYPDVPNLGDMTKLPERIRLSEIEAPDIFCGGTPCQAFSVAGLRKSLDDARGNLSLVFCEIANEIDAVRSVRGLQPATIFWENVPGVLSTKDNAFGCFLAGLAGEDDPLVAPGGKWANAGCVFGPTRAVAWRILDAQYFGVAQRRRRVFVVASARTGFDPAAVLFEFDGVRRDIAPSREKGEGTTHATAPCLTSSGRGVERTGDTRGQDPVVAVAGTLTASFGRLLGTSGQDADHGHSHLVAFGGNNTSGEIHVVPGLNCNGGQRSGDFEAGALLVQPLPFDTTQITSATNRSQPKAGDPVHPLAAGAHAPAIAFHPTQDPISSTDGSTHALGCGSSGGQASVAVAFQSSQSGVRIGDTHATLDANNGPRRHNGDLVDMQVRRLTPRECERLQYFQFRVTPDYHGAWEDAPGEWWSPDYTLIPGKTKKINPDKLNRDYIKYLARGGRMTFEQCCNAAADGPRYKALGNSWAVINVRWIGARIAAALAALDGKTEF